MIKLQVPRGPRGHARGTRRASAVAVNWSRHVNVDVLARELGGQSRHHLHKIVQDLTALGVAKTVRGAGGGVMLAKPPEAIRLGTLVRQLEGDPPLVECFRPEGSTCTFLPACRLRGMISGAQGAFFEMLDRNTLADCLPG